MFLHKSNACTFFFHTDTFLIIFVVNFYTATSRRLDGLFHSQKVNYNRAIDSLSPLHPNYAHILGVQAFAPITTKKVLFIN